MIDELRAATNRAQADKEAEKKLERARRYGIGCDEARADLPGHMQSVLAQAKEAAAEGKNSIYYSIGYAKNTVRNPSISSYRFSQVAKRMREQLTDMGFNVKYHENGPRHAYDDSHTYALHISWMEEE